MCGRVDQNDLDDVISDFAWVDELVRRNRAERLYNVAPGTRRPVLHAEGAALVLEDRFWGYQAPWAVGKVPVAINARMDKLAGRYWSSLLKRGRCIVPANGWYEWTGEKGKKQPWHIHRADGQLLYIAALACLAPQPEEAPPAFGGFALLTADAEGGLVDIHDRRPVVLTAADAATWMDPEISGEQAAELARNMALGPERFAWHAVSAALNKSTSQSAELALPLAEQPDFAKAKVE